jgi:hypothetical protein
VNAEIRAGFDRVYAQIESYFRSSDPAPRQALLVNPLLTEAFKQQLTRGTPAQVVQRQFDERFRGIEDSLAAGATEQALREVQSRLDAQAGAVAREVITKLKEAFTRAVSRIYFLMIFVVAAAWLVTLLVPELPLRRSNAPAVAPGEGG